MKQKISFFGVIFERDHFKAIVWAVFDSMDKDFVDRLLRRSIWWHEVQVLWLSGGCRGNQTKDWASGPEPLRAAVKQWLIPYWDQLSVRPQTKVGPMETGNSTIICSAIHTPAPPGQNGLFLKLNAAQGMFNKLSACDRFGVFLLVANNMQICLWIPRKN